MEEVELISMNILSYSQNVYSANNVIETSAWALDEDFIGNLTTLNEWNIGKQRGKTNVKLWHVDSIYYIINLSFFLLLLA